MISVFEIIKCIKSFFVNYGFVKLQNENFVTKTIVNKKKCYKIKKKRSQYNVVYHNKISQLPLVFIQDEPSIKFYKESRDKESRDKECDFGPYLRYMYQMS
jgi:hypothetical protein